MKRLWMKTLILAIVGLSIGAILFIVSQPRKAIRPVFFKETVFVDITELEEFHPQTKLLADMAKLIAEMSSGANLRIGSVEARVESQDILPNSISADVADKSRQAMSAQVLGEADRALTLWEQDRKKSLSVRLAWNRKNMMTRAQDAIWFNKNDVYNRTGDQLMDVERKYGFPMLNHRLSIKALELGSDLHGYKPPEIPPKLEMIREELALLGKQYLGEKQTVDAWMQEEIDRIRSETMADVNSTLSRERVRSTVSIQSDVQKARERISSRLESVNSVKSKRLIVLPDVATDLIVRVRPELVRKDVQRIDTSGLVKSSRDIRKQIRDDVRALVMEEAGHMGVKVVFDRSQSNEARNMTADFARIIRNNVW